MPFIGAAVAAAVGLTGTAATVVGALVTTAISVGVSLGLSSLAKSLQPKPTQGEPNTGLETSIQIGGDIARQIVAGTCKAHGQLVYHNTYGSDNAYYEQVYVLSDWVSLNLTAAYVNGERRSVNPGAYSGGRYPIAVDGYTEFLEVDFFDGTQTNAFSTLVSNSNPAGRWDSNSILKGLSYVRIRWAYVKDHDVYAGGIPALAFEVAGARLYDWRKDSTAPGGSGAHRWDNVATWEFTENPVVVLYNYLRGFYINGERVLGMGVPAYDIVHESFTAAANACDETVTTTGSPEPRYRCSTILSSDQDVPHASTLDAILSTFAGYLYDYAGFYVCQAGVAQTAVKTVTDDELVVGQPVTFAAKRSRSELVNRIHGQFLDSGNNYIAQSYAAQISAGGAVNDGEELGRQLDLLSVRSRTQAERIARIRLREMRAQATASLTLGFDHIDLQAGDWLTWNSARFGNRTWRIVERDVDAMTKTVSLQLAEIDATVFSWTSADEGIAPAVPIRIEVGGRITTVSGFLVLAGVITNADGRTIPALEFQWTPITDPSVDAVKIEYRKDTGTETTPSKVTDFSPEDGSLIVTDGVVGDTAYEARATIITTPPRLTTWTSWFDVVTEGEIVQVGDLVELLDAEIDSIATLGISAIQDAILSMEEQIGHLGADGALEATTAKYERDILYSRTNDNRALIVTEQTARADETSALAQQMTTLSTEVSGSSATLVELSESVDGISVRHGVVGTINGISGGFIFSGVQQLDGSVTYGVEIDGDLLVSGTITGPKLAVEEIITNTVQLQNLIVGTEKINFNATNQFYQTSGGMNSYTGNQTNTYVNGVASVAATGVGGGYLYISLTVSGRAVTNFAGKLNSSSTYRIRRTSDNAVLREYQLPMGAEDGGAVAAIVNTVFYYSDAATSTTYQVDVRPNFTLGGGPSFTYWFQVEDLVVEVRKR